MINGFRTTSVWSFFVFRHTLTHIWDGSTIFNSIATYSGYSLLLTSPRCRLHQYTADWACLQTFKSHEILNFSQILNSPYIDILIGKRFKPLHNIASRRTQQAEANKHGKCHFCFSFSYLKRLCDEVLYNCYSNVKTNKQLRVKGW